MNMQTGLLNWTPYMNKHVHMHSAYRTAETHMHTSLLRNVHKQAHVCACAQVTAAAAAAAERAEPRRSRLPPAHARRLAAQADRQADRRLAAQTDRQADRPLAARLRRFAAAPGLESRGKHRPTDRQTSHGCPWWRRLCPTTAAAAAACVAVAAAAADARAAAALAAALAAAALAAAALAAAALAAAALAAAALAAAALAAAGQCLPHRRDASVHATRAAVL